MDEASLPYIDHEYESPAMRHTVNTLLAQEMAAHPFDPAEYEARLPPLPPLDLTPPTPTPLDTSRYSIPTHPDLSAAVANGGAVAGAAMARAANAKLARKHGAGGWKDAVALREDMLAVMGEELARVKGEGDKVNQKRAREQGEAKPGLVALERQYQMLVMKNAALAEAVSSIPAESRFKTLYVFESDVLTLVEVKRLDLPKTVTDKGKIYAWMAVANARIMDAGASPLYAPGHVLPLTFEAMPSSTERVFEQAFLDMDQDFTTATLLFRSEGAVPLVLQAKDSLTPRVANTILSSSFFQQ